MIKHIFEDRSRGRKPAQLAIGPCDPWRVMATSVSIQQKLEAVDDVDIDNSGKFKYVLIKLGDGTDSKYIARGYDWAEFHADIFEEVAPGLRTLGLKPKCCGGGRIQHNEKEKKILVYGYSMAYGPADHQITVDLLKRKYPGYNEITFTNEGY